MATLRPPCARRSRSSSCRPSTRISGLSQGVRFVRRNEQDAVAVAEHLGQAADPRGNHRNTERQSEKKDSGLTDVPVRHDEHVGRAEVSGHIGERNVVESVHGARARAAQFSSSSRRSGCSWTGSPATTRRAPGRAAVTVLQASSSTSSPLYSRM